MTFVLYSVHLIIIFNSIPKEKNLPYFIVSRNLRV